MDLKVCGKLLTHHWRGYGVDVEALCDRYPSGGAPEKAPRWDLTGTEGCGDGNRVSWCSWMFLGYMGIYRRKKYVGGAARGPWGWGVRLPPGHALLPRGLLASFLTSTPSLLDYIFFPKILPKFSFHLDSVWYSFFAEHWNRKKNSTLHWAFG